MNLNKAIFGFFIVVFGILLFSFSVKPEAKEINKENFIQNYPPLNKKCSSPEWDKMKIISFIKEVNKPYFESGDLAIVKEGDEEGTYVIYTTALDDKVRSIYTVVDGKFCQYSFGELPKKEQQL